MLGRISATDLGRRTSELVFALRTGGSVQITHYGRVVGLAVPFPDIGGGPMQVNGVVLVGNLTDAPKYVQKNGTRVSSFVLASDRDYKKADGTDASEVAFVEVSVFGDQAEHTAQSLVKGSRIFAHGRLKTDNYENEQGEKRSRLKMIADVIGPTLEFNTIEPERVTT